MKQKPIAYFMSHEQRVCVLELLSGEEGEFFHEKLAELQAVVDTMPTTGETDGQGDEALVRLHYFLGNCDVWVTELDKGAPDDTPEDWQRQAFGLCDLGCEPELGYVSIPEVIGAGMEMDFHWQPITVGQIKEKKARAA